MDRKRKAVSSMNNIFPLLILVLCALVFFVPQALALESSGTVSCTSASVPVQVIANLGTGTVVNVPYNAAVGVYIIKDNTTSCANSTAGAGYPILPNNAQDFLSREDGYTGQLCCLLMSGSTAVSVGYNKR